MIETRCLYCKTPIPSQGYCNKDCMEKGQEQDRKFAESDPCYCGMRPDGGRDYTCSYCRG